MTKPQTIQLQKTRAIPQNHAISPTYPIKTAAAFTRHAAKEINQKLFTDSGLVSFLISEACINFLEHVTIQRIRQACRLKFHCDSPCEHDFHENIYTYPYPISIKMPIIAYSIQPHSQHFPSAITEKLKQNFHIIDRTRMTFNAMFKEFR